MTFLSGCVFVSLNQRELGWEKHCTRFALMRNYNSFILIQRKNSPSFHSLYRLAENKTPTTSPGSFLSALQLEPQKFHALSTLMQRPRYKYIKTDAVLIRSHKINIFKQLAYTLTAYCNASKSVTQTDPSQSATYGTKYCVRQIVHKTTRTDINSRTLQAEVFDQLNFRNLKSRRKKISF